MSLKRTFITVLAVLLLMPTSLFAQDQKETETVRVSKSSLTPQQLAQVQLQDTAAKAKQYGEWVGIGKEVGVAVNDALASVTTQTNMFGQTDVGKVTIAVVVWKVIGRDLMGFVVGGMMLLVGVPVWIWVFYRNCMTRRVLVSTNEKKERTWELVNNPADYPARGHNDVNYVTTQRNIHFLVLIFLILIAISVMFT